MRSTVAEEKSHPAIVKVPAREGIRTPRVTAHVFAPVTNRRISDVSSLRYMSSLASSGVGSVCFGFV